MNLVARSLRAARPIALSNLARTAPVRTMPALAAARRAFSQTSVALEKRYTKDHEWIDINPTKKTGVIGISEYAAEQLGDVVYVELPEIGDWVDAGDAIGAVESVKSASDINSPLRCKVTHVNVTLEEKPSTINQLPEDDSAGGGWLAKVEIDDQSIEQMKSLMDADEYAAFTNEAEH